MVSISIFSSSVKVRQTFREKTMADLIFFPHRELPVGSSRFLMPTFFEFGLIEDLGKKKIRN